MKIVTAGYPYVDIDAYAGCVAYAELLNKKGVEAAAVTTAPLNESIPKIVQDWHPDIKTNYTPSDQDEFTLIDLSDPDYIDKIVDPERITEVIDHHVGFEEYWQEKLGDGARIEFIGAACTLVYELWRDAGKITEISQTSARLLICGILDNTLNFGAKITTQRDREAFEQLRQYAELPEDWPQQYFEACETTITADLNGALGRDTKDICFKSFGDEPLTFGQILVWDAEHFLKQYDGEVIKALGQSRDEWFVNIISLKHGQSFFLSTSAKVKSWLESLLGIVFQDNLGQADRLWLRKEVIKQELIQSHS